MITKDVRKWIEKVERKQYSYQDAMIEFANFSKYLTIEELKFIKNKLGKSYKT